MTNRIVTLRCNFCWDFPTYFNKILHFSSITSNLLHNIVRFKQQIRQRTHAVGVCLARIGKCLGCRHSPVDSSAPSILAPWVQVPSTPSKLLSIYIDLCHVEKTKITKRGRDWPIFKKNRLACLVVKHFKSPTFKPNCIIIIKLKGLCRIYCKSVANSYRRLISGKNRKVSNFF